MKGIRVGEGSWGQGQRSYFPIILRVHPVAIVSLHQLTLCQYSQSDDKYWTSHNYIEQLPSTRKCAKHIASISYFILTVAPHWDNYYPPFTDRWEWETHLKQSQDSTQVWLQSLPLLLNAGHSFIHSSIHNLVSEYLAPAVGQALPWEIL